MTRPILITGATGFVGKHLVAAMQAAGDPLRCASRDPAGAARRRPDLDWVRLDIQDPGSIRAAMEGARAAVYLVHLMADGEGYADRERAAAMAFAGAAGEAGLERIVYLGGVAPQGEASAHLKSRLDTGALLRAGPVPTIELRAGMIIGEGSEGWKICRDLAVRLPFMILPHWLASRSCPVGIDDMVVALRAALDLNVPGSRVFDVPGPDVISAEDILLRVARLRGLVPTRVHLPLLTPTLSSLWLKLVSGADYAVAQELVQGLTHDLLPSQPSIWTELPDHRPLSFDEAARRAMAQEKPPRLGVRLIEGLARRVSGRHLEAE